MQDSEAEYATHALVSRMHYTVASPAGSLGAGCKAAAPPICGGAPAEVVHSITQQLAGMPVGGRDTESCSFLSRLAASEQHEPPAQQSDHAQTLPPSTSQQVQVVRLDTNFRAATEIARLPLQHPPPPGYVTIRISWAGVNASDVNFTSGRYMGSKQVAEKLLPFGAGFEASGTVVAVASDVAGARYSLKNNS